LLKTSAANFDAVFVPGGDSHIEALAREPQATQFIASALGRGRVIGAAGAGRALLSMAGVHATTADEGAAGDSAAGRIVAGRIIVEDGEETLGNLMCRFIAALLQHPVQADAEPDALPSGSGFGAMPLT